MTQVSRGRREGFSCLRLMMVLSSMAPLFILWAIRGTSFFPAIPFITVCLLMAAFPAAVLWIRLWVAKREGDSRSLTVGSHQDSRDHILVYLLAMLLPFYRPDFETWRDVGAILAVLGLIVSVFWTMNLHYINIIFTLFGFRIFTIFPVEDDNPYSGRGTWILISKRGNLTVGQELTVLRVTNTLYLEEGT